MIERIDNGEKEENTVTTLDKRMLGPDIKISSQESLAMKIKKKFLTLPQDPPERVLFVARTYVVPFVVIPFTVIFWNLMEN